MNKEQKKSKIISCYGHVNMKSTAKMTASSEAYVIHIWTECGFKTAKPTRYLVKVRA